MIGDPLILYIPGLLPKPAPAAHKDALQRCLLAGLDRIDAGTADAIRRSGHVFDIVSWTFDFYGENRDIALDAAAIDAVIAQEQATDKDLREAASLQRRTARLIFSLADLLPFLIPHIANERQEVHIQDLLRYTRNHDDIADHIRRMLKLPLRAAAESGRRVLLLAHSMGSVIAWDTLWEMTHEDGDDFAVDLIVTMGSPLGQRFIQRRLKGYREKDAYRYPHNIRRWINLSAVGDMTSIDPTLADDFAAMPRLGLVESIEDCGVQNYFRLDGELNVHAEYGYLANAVTARIVSDWWNES